MSAHRKVSIIVTILIACLVAGPAVGSALAASKPIASLTEFTGEVIVRTQGAYGTFPQVGMPLFSDDQIATRDGSATITFDDGAVLNIEANSNTIIEQIEKKEGTVAKVKRRFMLLLGKLRFKTGSLGSNTSLATPTAVCGLRGTAGTLSIGADGTPMVSFTEGGRSQTLGELIDGVAEDLPKDVAEQNAIQYATFQANAFALARTAQEQAAGDGILPPSYEKTLADNAQSDEQLAEMKAKALSPEGQAALASYWQTRLAQETAATVMFIANNIANNSPDPDIVSKYRAMADEAQGDLLKAQVDVQNAITRLEELGLIVPEDPAPFVLGPGFVNPGEPGLGDLTASPA